MVSVDTCAPLRGFYNPKMTTKPMMRATTPTAIAVSYTHLDVYKRQAEDFLYLFRFVAESNQQSSPLGRIETVNPAAKLLNHGLPGRFGFAFFGLPDGLKVMMRIQELQQAAP